MAQKVKPPSDFEDEAAFLAHCRKTIALDMQADKKNRDAALEDMKFLVGEQWDPAAKAKREGAKKPALTFNRLIAFLAQVLGNRRLNETLIQVVPDHGGTKEVAKIRQGLIRNIQKVSRADVAYDKAHENQVSCGIGNFRVTLEYAHDDVFEQDIRIGAIVNALAVIWDRMSVEPTGEDADHVTVFDSLPKELYKRKYPGAQISDAQIDTTLMGELLSEGWIEGETVRVAAYWRMLSRMDTLALFKDGSVRSVVGRPPEEWVGEVVQREDGSPVIRESPRKYAQLYVMSGTALLEGPYELPVDSVPVFRVPGWEINVGDERHRFGLVRWLKDPIRLQNYWRSVIAEKLTQAPKATWIARLSAVIGREKEWRDSHLSDSSLLVFNDDAAEAPQRVPPIQIEQALLTEAATSVQDIKDISNIHEASLGQQSNEVSGKAIIARQRVGELGTVIYQDLLNLAIERCGRLCNQLIPVVYDTPRTVKIIGSDDKEVLVAINGGAMNPDAIDITLGKYAVSVTTGPSYTTKRIESSEAMLNMVNAMPQTMAAAADKIVAAQDWPDAEDIARRLRRGLPPGMVLPDDMTEEEKAEAQQQNKVNTALAQHATEAADLALAKSRAEVKELDAKAELLRAQAEAIPDKTRIAAAKEHSTDVSRRLNDSLKAIETAHAGDDVNDNAGD